MDYRQPLPADHHYWTSCLSARLEIETPETKHITTSLDADRPNRLGGRVKAGTVGSQT